MCPLGSTGYLYLNCSVHVSAEVKKYPLRKAHAGLRRGSLSPSVGCTRNIQSVGSGDMEIGEWGMTRTTPLSATRQRALPLFPEVGPREGFPSFTCQPVDSSSPLFLASSASTPFIRKLRGLYRATYLAIFVSNRCDKGDLHREVYRLSIEGASTPQYPTLTSPPDSCKAREARKR